MAPTPVLLPGESQGWGSLVGCRRIPGTEEPGGLPSVGSHGVGHDRSSRDVPVLLLQGQFCDKSAMVPALLSPPPRHDHRQRRSVTQLLHL